MNCSESERRIYLYRELDDRDRAETDQHLETCPACREIMETANAAGSVIEAWQRLTPALTNEAQMTSRIMDTVRKEQARKTAGRTYFEALRMSALRYGMGAISLLLVAFFLGEYAKDSEVLQTAERYPATTEHTTELDLAAFRSAFFAAKKKDQQRPTSIFQCLRDCLHSERPECSDCVEKYSKP